MKLFDNKNTSTTSIIAVLFVLFGFGLLGYIAVQTTDDQTTRTQLVTGIFSILSAVGGYYFGAMRNRVPEGEGKTTITTETTKDI